MGYIHIDIWELRLSSGKLNMFLAIDRVAIDRVSKFTCVEVGEEHLFWLHPRSSGGCNQKWYASQARVSAPVSPSQACVTNVPP